MLGVFVWAATVSSSGAKKEYAKKIGYARTVIAGSTDNGHTCSDTYTVWVANSTDEIQTGTAVYTNPACTISLPNTIIAADAAIIDRKVMAVRRLFRKIFLKASLNILIKSMLHLQDEIVYAQRLKLSDRV